MMCLIASRQSGTLIRALTSQTIEQIVCIYPARYFLLTLPFNKSIHRLNLCSNCVSWNYHDVCYNATKCLTVVELSPTILGFYRLLCPFSPHEIMKGNLTVPTILYIHFSRLFRSSLERKPPIRGVLAVVSSLLPLRTGT